MEFASDCLRHKIDLCGIPAKAFLWCDPCLIQISVDFPELFHINGSHVVLSSLSLNRVHFSGRVSRLCSILIRICTAVTDFKSAGHQTLATFSCGFDIAFEPVWRRSKDSSWQMRVSGLWRENFVFSCVKALTGCGYYEHFFLHEFFVLYIYHADTLRFTCEKYRGPLVLLVPFSIMVNTKEGAWNYCDLACWSAAFSNLVKIH